VTDYYGQRAKPGTWWELQGGIRAGVEPAVLTDTLTEIAHYWSAVCEYEGRLVADYRHGEPTIYRYEGPVERFPYDLSSDTADEGSR
jgi:hypothetical protein